MAPKANTTNAPSLKLPQNSQEFVGMKMYMPAIIALVAYIIMGMVILLPFEYPVYNERTDTMYVLKYNFGQRLVILLLMTIPIALSVYTINCMMAGSCLVWSYIISIATVLWITMFVLSAIIYTFAPKTEDPK